MFCGVGGSAIGYSKAMNLKLVTDRDRAVHDAVLPGVERMQGDIAAARFRNAFVQRCKELGINVVLASPPCTDFSKAGNRTEGKSASLVNTTFDVIEELMPRGFLIENVVPFVYSKTFLEAKERSERLGYDSVVFKVNCSFYGVAQSRVRLFWVGVDNSRNFNGVDGLEKWVAQLQLFKSIEATTVRDVISPDFQYYYICPRNLYKRGIYSVDHPAPTLRTNCTNRFPVKYEARHSDSGPASESRELTLSQLARIQGFGEGEFVFEGLSRTTVGVRIGNSVPPPITHLLGSLAIQLFSRSPDVDFRRVGKTSIVGIQVSDVKPNTRKSRIVIFCGGDKNANLGVVCAAFGASYTKDVDGIGTMVYTVGTSMEGDKRACELSGCNLFPGIVVEIRDRKNKRYSYDDTYWRVPGERVPIRSKAGIKECCNSHK